MHVNKMLFKNRLEFRAWLSENAQSDEGVWLVFSKTRSLETIKAHEALEEAICYGWIDGLMESVDEETYVKYFKQRSSTSKWSEKNKALAEKLEQQGLMTDLGRAKIKIAKENGRWDSGKPEPPLTDDQMRQFADMLKPYETAYMNFLKMPKSARSTYMRSFFNGAKTADGKQKRFKSIVERLTLNLNPMENMKKILPEA